MWYEWDKPEDKEALEDVLRTLNEFKKAIQCLPTHYSVPVDNDGDLEFRMDMCNEQLGNLKWAVESHIKLLDKLNNGEFEYDEDGDLIY